MVAEPTPDELCDIRQAANFLQVHPKTLYGWVEAHRIPHVRLGTRTIRFRRSDLLAFLDSLAVPARP
jgi:excisionase family DNA binding protein